MKEELRVIDKNKTWSLVDRTDSMNVIGTKWIFRTKYNADGSINKHKASLVAKGYVQRSEIDFTDTFALVARFKTVKLLLAIAGGLGWEVYHLDIKSAFLNGVLQEDIYVEILEGLKVNDRVNKVYKLHKALYGLKQAPRAWYSKMDSYLESKGFCKSVNEPTLYVLKVQDQVMLMVSLYVDDLFITGSASKPITQFKAAMKTEFDMTDLGKMRYYLGFQVDQFDQDIFLCQKTYIAAVLEKFNMEKCKSVATPMVVNDKFNDANSPKLTDPSIYRSLIGSLLYACGSRPDIIFSVSYLSRFTQSPSIQHLSAAKRILRYLQGTLDLGLHFKYLNEVKLIGYSDSDFARDPTDFKSTSGYVFI
ncbi:Reverse transcriptase [Theobroma cacao]|nr:Reverse transcriptase [Theobroma cacao]